MKDLTALQEAIGVAFLNPSLLRRALTHASYLNENPDCTWGDNERLEFLGDAVGDFVAAELLYQRFPAWQEGPLTSLRAELVRSETLASFAAQLGLGRHLLLGRGEEKGGGRTRAAMLGDAFEALLGAIYLDQGLDAVRQFLLPFLESQVQTLAAEVPLRDAKTRLQEWAQAIHHEAPTYVLVGETGPDHAKQFAVEVAVMGEVRGRGTGSSKQAAEQAAAEAALEVISAQAHLDDHGERSPSAPHGTE